MLKKSSHPYLLKTTADLLFSRYDSASCSRTVVMLLPVSKYSKRATVRCSLFFVIHCGFVKAAKLSMKWSNVTRSSADNLWN